MGTKFSKEWYESHKTKGVVTADTQKKRKGRKPHEEILKEIHNTNSLTLGCIKLLNGSGFKVWRNNNNAVYDVKAEAFRTPAEGALKGVPDIIGYEKKTGLFIGVEIKAGKDILSIYQCNFYEDCLRDDATYLIIRHIDELIKWVDEKKVKIKTKK